MKLLRVIVLAVMIVAGFYYVTTHRRGELRAGDWLSRPTRLEITEAAAPSPVDAEEQNNITVYRKNIPTVVNVTSRTVTFDFFGHEIELLPRTLYINRKAHPWISNEAITLSTADKPAALPEPKPKAWRR